MREEKTLGKHFSLDNLTQKDVFFGRQNFGLSTSTRAHILCGRRSIPYRSANVIFVTTSHRELVSHILIASQQDVGVLHRQFLISVVLNAICSFAKVQAKLRDVILWEPAFLTAGFSATKIDASKKQIG